MGKGNDISEFTVFSSVNHLVSLSIYMALYGIDMYRKSWGVLEGISSHHGFHLGGDVKEASS
jgi:hypothetical protein